MFRESDMPAPRPHPTFSTKHKPPLQLQAQAASLEYYTKSQEPVALENIPVVAPTFDTVYDPSHPRADYAGLVHVEDIRQRRHMQGLSAQKGHIESGKGGLIGADDDKVKRITRLGKDSNSNDLIGGIGHNDAERFRTTYVRQADFEGTSRDQLTIEKQLGAKKQVKDPAQNRNSLVNPFEVERIQQSKSQIAFDPEAYKPNMKGKSLIKNLGASLVDLL